MGIKILEERRNVLLERKEVLAKADQKGATPKRDEVIKLLAAHYNVAEENIVIDKIEQKYGRMEHIIKAKIYDKPVRRKEVKEEGEGKEEVSEKAAEESKEEVKGEGSEEGKDEAKEEIKEEKDEKVKE